MFNFGSTIRDQSDIHGKQSDKQGCTAKNNLINIGRLLVTVVHEWILPESISMR